MDDVVTTENPMSFPRLRENLWHIYAEQGLATVITSQGSFHIDASSATKFLQMRSYCTGHHSPEVIAQRSGLPVEEVQGILAALDRAGLLLSPAAATVEAELSIEQIRIALTTICQLWSRELQLGYIGNEFVAGRLPKATLIGWLLEMYHYIRDFPAAISHAADLSQGRLKTILARYAKEERGHEEFVLQSLENLGLSRREVESSVPLLSTRLIGFLMRELFEIEPSAVLLVAALVEAQDFNDEQIASFKLKLSEHYGIGADALDPYFQHQAIDVGLGHAQLLAANLDLFEVTELTRLDAIVNRLHDVKHAFDLQGIEIKSYFEKLNGKYVPRQHMSFSAI